MTDPGGREAGQSEEDRPQSGVYGYVGKPVIIGYVAGPYLQEQQNPYGIARGRLEARQALFIVEDVGAVGVFVRRILGESEAGPRIFMPWSAIHQILELVPVDESHEG